MLAPLLLAAVLVHAASSQSNYVLDNYVESATVVAYAPGVCTPIVTEVESGIPTQTSVLYECQSASAVSKTTYTDSSCSQNAATTSFTGDFECGAETSYSTVGVWVNFRSGTTNCATGLLETSIAGPLDVCAQLPLLGVYGQMSCDLSQATVTIGTYNDSSCGEAAGVPSEVSLSACTTLFEGEISGFDVQADAQATACVRNGIAATRLPTAAPTARPTTTGAPTTTMSPTTLVPTPGLSDTGTGADNGGNEMLEYYFFVDVFIAVDFADNVFKNSEPEYKRFAKTACRWAGCVEALALAFDVGEYAAYIAVSNVTCTWKTKRVSFNALIEVDEDVYGTFGDLLTLVGDDPSAIGNLFKDHWDLVGDTGYDDMPVAEYVERVTVRVKEYGCPGCSSAATVRAAWAFLLAAGAAVLAW